MKIDKQLRNMLVTMLLIGVTGTCIGTVAYQIHEIENLAIVITAFFSVLISFLSMEVFGLLNEPRA